MVWPCSWSAIVLVADAHDRHVERGQQHAEQQPGEHRHDLAVRQRAPLPLLPRARRARLTRTSTSPLRNARVAAHSLIIAGRLALVVGRRTVRAGRGTCPRPRAPTAGLLEPAPARSACAAPRGARAPASVGTSTLARPSSGSALRSTRPSRTSAATCLLTVDGSECTAAASALDRLGPRTTSVLSSMIVERSTPPALLILCAERRLLLAEREHRSGEPLTRLDLPTGSARLLRSRSPLRPRPALLLLLASAN